MIIKLLAGPLVGSLIGYLTNYIAVKMLFHPYKEVKIGKLRLPFTPGIIPKEKNRLGRAIAEAVTKSLLTEEMLTKAFLSEDSIAQIESLSDEFLDRMGKNETSLKNAVASRIGTEKYEELTETILEKISLEVSDYLIKANLGVLVKEQAVKLVSEKLGGGLFAMFGGAGIVEPIGEEIEKMVNSYIEDHGEDMVYQFLMLEQNKMERTTISEISGYVDGYREEIRHTVVELYEKLITSYMPQMLEKLNLQELIEQKIAEMDIAELEELCMSVMKKELNAIVNLGALIGAIIGILNMLISLM